MGKCAGRMENGSLAVRVAVPLLGAGLGAEKQFVLTTLLASSGALVPIERARRASCKISPSTSRLEQADQATRLQPAEPANRILLS